jgi:putative thioredoxin
MDITLANFEADLIESSVQQPVLLDIWAPWCGPCKSLTPVLERLEAAYAGRFVLAKLNADDVPEIAGQLSQMFGVRSIPFCVMFKDGQPVDGFVGALPEAQIRSFLDKHVPSEAEVAAADDLDEAQALLAEGDADAALARLQEAVAINPADDNARYAYLRALLQSGHVDEARVAFAPVHGRVIVDQRLAAIGQWLAAVDAAPGLRPAEVLHAAVAANKRDFAARFDLARGHLVAQRWTEALDELLEILMRDKAWQDESARKMYVGILELMAKPAAPAPAAASPAGKGDGKGALEIAGKGIAAAPGDPVVDQYRRKLSMVLF